MGHQGSKPFGLVGISFTNQLLSKSLFLKKQYLTIESSTNKWGKLMYPDTMDWFKLHGKEPRCKETLVSRTNFARPMTLRYIEIPL